LSTADITTGQPIYDFIVDKTGCSSSSNTLDCLRAAPFEVLLDAMNGTPSLFAYSSLKDVYLPMADGVFLTENAQDLLAKGQFTRVSLRPRSDVSLF
jgi:acetylcholinesterase